MNMVCKKNAKGAKFTGPHAQHELARVCERGGGKCALDMWSWGDHMCVEAMC